MKVIAKQFFISLLILVLSTVSLQAQQGQKDVLASEESAVFNKDNVAMIIQLPIEIVKVEILNLKDELKEKPALLEKIAAFKDLSQFSTIYKVHAIDGEWVKEWFIGKKTSGQIEAFSNYYRGNQLVVEKKILSEKIWDQIESLYRKYDFSTILNASINKPFAAQRSIVSIRDVIDDFGRAGYEVKLISQHAFEIYKDANDKPFVEIFDEKGYHLATLSLPQEIFNMVDKLYKEKFAPKINPNEANKYEINWIEDTIEAKEVVGDSKNIDKQYAVVFEKEPHVAWIYSKDKQGNITAFVYSARPENKKEQKISVETVEYIEESALFSKENIAQIIQYPDEASKIIMSDIKDEITKKNPSLLQQIDPLFFKDVSQFKKIYTVSIPRSYHWYVGQKPDGQIIALRYTPGPQPTVEQKILSEKTWNLIASLYQKYDFSMPTDIQKMIVKENIILIKDKKDDTGFGFYYDVTLKNKYVIWVFQDKNNKPYMIVYDGKEYHGYTLPQATFDMIEKLYKEKFAPKINPNEANKYTIKNIEDTVKDQNVVGDSKNIDKQYAVVFEKEPHVAWIYSKDKQGNITVFVYDARPENKKEQKISVETFAYIKSEAEKVSKTASSAKK